MHSKEKKNYCQMVQHGGSCGTLSWAVQINQNAENKRKT